MSHVQDPQAGASGPEDWWGVAGSMIANDRHILIMSGYAVQKNVSDFDAQWCLLRVAGSESFKSFVSYTFQEAESSLVIETLACGSHVRQSSVRGKSSPAPTT